MPNVIKIRNGLNIPLKGTSEKRIEKAPPIKEFAVKPIDFHGIRPKVVAKPGSRVKAGSPVYYDKFYPDVQFTAPVSGEVKEIVRGEKRKILEITIEADEKIEYESFDLPDFHQLDAESVRKLMLKAGLWPAIVKRPYGVIPEPDESPDYVYVSAFDTHPLAPDMDFVIAQDTEAYKKGLEVMHILTARDINMGLHKETDTSPYKDLSFTKLHYFDGPHPAGNVGVQINKLKPINKGKIYWTISPQQLIIIGRFFQSGKTDFRKLVALTGSELRQGYYSEFISGGCLKGFVDNNLIQDNLRVISGNVLTGTQVGIKGKLGYFDNQVSVIPEGNYYEFFGWAMPGFNKFSHSRTFISWLMPNKKYNIDTNLHGGRRAYVITGEYEKVCPLDIYPQQLIKACMTEDIDKMEQLGIYEVVEEDLALCEFVCTSKTEVQQILRDSLDMLRKEFT